MARQNLGLTEVEMVNHWPKGRVEQAYMTECGRRFAVFKVTNGTSKGFFAISGNSEVTDVVLLC